MQTDESIAKQIFADIKKQIPAARDIAAQAVERVLPKNSDFESALKNQPSHIISSIEAEAYRLYLEQESQASGRALAAGMVEATGSRTDAAGLLSFVEGRFQVFDKLCLSLAQSRKSRAGSTFEAIVSHILDRLGYPYTSQAVIMGGKPDFILPSLEHYNAYPSDCIVLTCKRTLRERWRQIVTEGVTGTFFLATLDAQVNRLQVKEMNDRRVTLVVPEAVKIEKYSSMPNVMSFEYFFQHHMDPAMGRWKAASVIQQD
jgi:hypothetical protein